MSRWVKFDVPDQSVRYNAQEPSRDDVIIDRLLRTNDELQRQIQELHQQLREEQRAKDAAVHRLAKVSDLNVRTQNTRVQNNHTPPPQEPETTAQEVLAEQMSALFNADWENSFQSLSMDLIFKGKKDNDRHICSILFETFMDCFKFCSDTAKAQLSDLEQNIADLTFNLHLETTPHRLSDKNSPSQLSRTSTQNSDRSVHSEQSEQSHISQNSQLSHRSQISHRSQLSQRSQQTQTSGQQRLSVENSNPSKAKKEKIVPANNVKTMPFYNAMIQLIKDRRKAEISSVVLEKMKTSTTNGRCTVGHIIVEDNYKNKMCNSSKKYILSHKCVHDQQRRLRKYWNQHLRRFVEKCTELSWLMSVQDPPMDIIWKVDRGTPFDHLYFTPYSKPASKIDYIIWPAVLLHTLGPVVCKGVAQAFE